MDKDPQNEKQPGDFATHIDELTLGQYSALAQDTFSQMERFALNTMPELWSQETTILQAQLTTLVFARQMSAKKTSVARLIALTGIPRTTVQNSVDRLIDLGWLDSERDPDDGRVKLLKVSPRQLNYVGYVERLLVQDRLESFHRIRQMPEFEQAGEDGATE